MADRSVSFESETNEKYQTVVKPKVKKWKQQYKTEYTKSWDCITKSNKSDKHAFCTVCSVDISVAHGGRQDITTPPYSSLIIYADLPNFTVVRLASLHRGCLQWFIVGCPIYKKKS